MKYVEVEVFGNQYRLLGSINNLLPLTINGVSYKTPFSDKLNGINIVQIGKSLTFSTNFGLTIQWSSHDFATYHVSLCDAYAGFVCGLCGNADGKIFSNLIEK